MIRQKAAKYFYKTIERIPKGFKLRLARTPLLGIYRRVSTFIGQGVPEGYKVIQSGVLEGKFLYIGPASSRGYSSVMEYLAGNYEPGLAEAMQKYGRPGTTVLDIGAHFGYFSLILSQCVGAEGRCIAFEALSENAEKISKTVYANTVENIQVENLAISDEDGNVSFEISSNSFMGKLKASAADSQFEFKDRLVSVKAMTLDSYVNCSGLDNISLIKIDVEGAERKVVRGGNKTILNHKPVLLVEVHSFENAGVHAQPFIFDLINLGYRIYHLANNAEILPMGFSGGHIIALPVIRGE